MDETSTIDREFEEELKDAYKACGSVHDASGNLDVDGFLKACFMLKEHIPSLHMIRPATLQNLYRIALRHYAPGTPMTLNSFRGAVDHLLKPGHEHAKDLYEMIISKIRTRRSSVGAKIDRISLDESLMMDTKAQFRALLSRPELDGLVINDAALAEVYLLIMTYGARLSAINNVVEHRTRDHHASIITGLSAIWREHLR